MVQERLPAQIDKVMRRKNPSLQQGAEIQQISVAAEKMGIGKLGAVLHLRQTLACRAVDILTGTDGLGQQIPLRFLLAIGQAVVVMGLKIPVVVDVPVQILQQVIDAPGFLPQVLPPLLQKRAEPAGIVGSEGVPDLLQAEAELLEVLHPADVADLVVAVIAIAGLRVRTIGDHYAVFIVKTQRLRRDIQQRRHLTDGIPVFQAPYLLGDKFAAFGSIIENPRGKVYTRL